MADILDGLASMKPQDVDFEKRISDKLRALRDGSKQLLMMMIQQREGLRSALFADPQTPPQSVIARMEPGEAYSLIERDGELAEFLTRQLAKANVPQETIAVLVRGVPDQYVLAVDPESQTVTVSNK